MISASWMVRLLRWREEFHAALDPADRDRVQPEPFKVAVDARLVRGGAYYQAPRSGESHLVRFSAYLFQDEVRDIWAHEYAHLIVEVIYGRLRRDEDHGTEWRGVMRRLGAEPRRYWAWNLRQRRDLARKFSGMRNQLWIHAVPEARVGQVG